MNNMTSEDKFYLGLWALVAIVVSIAIVTFSTLSAYQTKEFVRGGYIQGTVPGESGMAWVKP